MAIPALVVYTQEAMADKVARALNLAADRDLFNSADGGAFLDLVDKYIRGRLLPHPLAQPFNYVVHFHKFINNTLNVYYLDNTVAQLTIHGVVARVHGNKVKEGQEADSGCRSVHHELCWCVYICQDICVCVHV